jgi:ribonucleoside-diphosphate reductase alpha chain
MDNLIDLLKYAHSKKLKGFTLYREGSRDGVLKAIESKPTIKLDTRPKTLQANIHSIKIEGKDWLVLIGLLENKPYEIFALKVNNITLKNITTALLEQVDVKGEIQYNLISDQLDIKNLTSYYTSGNEEIFTRLLSRLFKIEGGITNIIKDFDSVNPIIGTFENSIKKVLYNYTITENLEKKCPECGNVMTLEGGCIKCYSCGFEQC